MCFMCYFSTVARRLRHEGVLLSRDGPHENVIKFKPPMCITIRDADEVCDKISSALSEFEIADRVSTPIITPNFLTFVAFVV